MLLGCGARLVELFSLCIPHRMAPVPYETEPKSDFKIIFNDKKQTLRIKEREEKIATKVYMKNPVFWDKTMPCSSCRSRRFGEHIAFIFRVRGTTKLEGIYSSETTVF
jgi:hypothetical protein